MLEVETRIESSVAEAKLTCSSDCATSDRRKPNRIPDS